MAEGFIMERIFFLVLFLIFCCHNAEGIEVSDSKEMKLDLPSKNSNTRKLLQFWIKGNNNINNNHAQFSISPSPAPSHIGTQNKHDNFAVSPSKVQISPIHPPFISPFFPPVQPPSISPVPSFPPSPSPLLKPLPAVTKQNPNPNPKYNIPKPAYKSWSAVPPSVAVPVNSHKRNVNSWPVYVMVIGGVSLIIVISTLLFVCIRAKKVVTVKPWATGLSGQLQKAFVKGVPALKRSEVENACELFSNIIGYFDSHCTMYKGTLSSGVEIAVVSSMAKSAKHWSKQCESQFRKKITTLSKVNHKNFVNLLGYCEEEKPFTRMLVFEYAPNGTLFEHLHNEEAEHLDWPTRVRIAVGIAYCLEHMHQLDPPVILPNLHSSTIYLTDDFAAKVSDLNLLTESKETSDPENIVYKYGIILLEIISGRVPLSDEAGPLEIWFSSFLRGERALKDMVDPSLKSFDENMLGALCDVIRACVDADHTERPSMEEVASRMREITEMPPDGAIPKVSPLWWAELEIMSSEAN